MEHKQHRQRHASEWISVTHNGIESDSRVILYEGYGGNPEIDVILMAEKAEVTDTEYTFRVTDMADRECTFRKSSQNGEASPSEVALKSLARFGWNCNNYSITGLRRTEAEQVETTIQEATGLLQAIAKHECEPFGTHPFLIDVVQECVNALLFLDMVLSYFSGDEEGTLDERLEHVLTEEPELLKQYIMAYSQSEGDSELILAHLAERHYDMELSQDTLDKYEPTDLPQNLQSLALGDAYDRSEELTQRTFDEVRDLATEVSEQTRAGTNGLNRLRSRFDLNESQITVEFVKVNCVNMPYILDHEKWQIPTTNDAKRETLKQAVIMRIRENNPELRFARSTEQAREMMAE